MESNIKLDIVIDYISSSIADIMRELEKEKKDTLMKELGELMHKREQIYNGNIELIEQIYNEIKK
jgi:hypothetical protein